jgi:hypothetical protein
MKLSTLKQLLRRIVGLEARVTKLERRPPSVGHLLHPGGEIKPQPGEFFAETLRRHREYENARVHGGVSMAKRFQDENRYRVGEVKWRED